MDGFTSNGVFKLQSNVFKHKLSSCGLCLLIDLCPWDIRNMSFLLFSSAWLKDSTRFDQFHGNEMAGKWKRFRANFIQPWSMILFLFSWVFTRYKYGKAIFSKNRNENLRIAIAYEPKIVLIDTIRTYPIPSKADIIAVTWEFTSSFFIFWSCVLELSGIIGSLMSGSWTWLNWLKLNLIRLTIKDLIMIYSICLE